MRFNERMFRVVEFCNVYYKVSRRMLMLMFASKHMWDTKDERNFVFFRKPKITTMNMSSNNVYRSN